MDYRALYGETADEREPLERYRSIGGGFRALNGKAPEVFILRPDVRRSSETIPITI